MPPIRLENGDRISPFSSILISPVCSILKVLTYEPGPNDLNLHARMLLEPPPKKLFSKGNAMELPYGYPKPKLTLQTKTLLAAKFWYFLKSSSTLAYCE